MKRVLFEDSTAVQSGKYRRKAATLEIVFNSGATYVFENVALATWEAMLASTSVGRFVAKHITGKYSALKISDGNE